MTNEQVTFFDVLFPNEKHVVFGNSNKIPFLPHPLEPDLELPEFYKINAYDPDAPRTSDEFIIEHRNFMFEADTGTLEDQLLFWRKLGMPYTALIWSGGKSIHCILSLDENLTRDAYLFYQKWIFNVASVAARTKGIELDPSSSNPGRFTRTPGAVRAANGKTQDLLELNQRCSSATLSNWLAQFQAKRPFVKKSDPMAEYRRYIIPPVASEDFDSERPIYKRTQAFLADPFKYWGGKGGRHELIKTALYDLLIARVPIEKVTELLVTASDLLGCEATRVPRLIEWAECKDLPEQMAAFDWNEPGSGSSHVGSFRSKPIKI
jgi:hypothetical protein